MDSENNKTFQGIKSWSEDDRPREKLIAKGAKALRKAELIAILFGNGTKSKSAVDLARELLATADDDLNKLSKKSIKDLQKVNGIGPAKAVTLVAALELFKRRQHSEIKIEKITCSKDCFYIAKESLEDSPVELFLVIYCNRSNTIVHKEIISVGGTSATVVDLKVIFKIAHEHLASNIIIAHNHPAGSLKPSSQDISITNKIKEAAIIMEMSLLDHIIIAGENYYSFADEGML